MLISSDEVDVSTEEDVFKVILNWIDRNKRERKKYFADLFREVRLVYVSRDYLHSDIVTNDLVNDNEGCMDLVKDAIKVIDSEEYRALTKPGTWNIPEHPGTFRNIPEQGKLSQNK